MRKSKSKRYIIVLLLLVISIFSYAQQIPIILEKKVPQIDEKSVNERYESLLKKADKRISSTTHTTATVYDNRKEIFFRGEKQLDRKEQKMIKTYRDISMIKRHKNANFYHQISNTLFPYKLLKGLRRSDIKTDNKNTKELTVAYTDSDKSIIMIHLIPNSEGSEGRLRETYEKEKLKLNKILPQWTKPTQSILQFKGIDYDTNGIQALYERGNQSIAYLTVYECGSWLLNITILAKGSQKSGQEMELLNNELIQYFNPPHLVELQPFNLKSNLEFDKKNLKNNPTIGALWASAMKKLEWVEEHISQRERATGFPDLYLDMHIAATEEYMNALAKKKWPNHSKSKQLYHTIQKIQSAGFLPDFFMQHYENLLVVPKGLKLNPAAYEIWKEENKIHTEEWKKKPYRIVYRNLNY